jgi:hypothetical protein
LVYHLPFVCVQIAIDDGVYKPFIFFS